MGRIAGIDYGKARIGIALSDESKFLASPLKVVCPGKNMAETARFILEAVGDVEAIVLGLPLKMNGQESPMSQEVRELEKELKKHIPTRLWDERLTTAGVEKMMLQQGVKRKKRSQVVDTLAAVAILQNYLESL